MEPISQRTSFVGLISRPKLVGLGTHAGVALPDGRVAHMTPSGAAIVSWGEFAHGLPVRQEKPASSEQYRQLQWRAVQSIGHTKPYNLAERNCEHYATWVMGEKPESPQINFVVLLGLAGLLLALSR